MRLLMLFLAVWGLGQGGQAAPVEVLIVQGESLIYYDCYPTSMGGAMTVYINYPSGIAIYQCVLSQRVFPRPPGSQPVKLAEWRAVWD